MERGDRNCFGLMVSALKLEGAVLEVVLWLALFPGTAVVTLSTCISNCLHQGCTEQTDLTFNLTGVSKYKLRSPHAGLLSVTAIQKLLCTYLLTS